MENVTSYLHNLQFDEKLRNSVIFKYITNLRLVILLTLMIIGIGLYSFLNIPRTLNPDIKIPIVIVSTILPGAGPKDVESLVTIPVEDALSGLTNVKTVTSSSNDSVSVVTLEFNSGVDPDKAQQDVQTAVNNVTTLPTDAKTPTVTKLDFSHAPIWVFDLGTKNDTGSLMRYAKILRDKIKHLSTISEVDVSGLDEQEVQITIKPDEIVTYGLNPQQVSAAIESAIKAFPAGSVSTDKNSFTLAINQQAVAIDDIRNLQISVGTQIIPLGNLADVAERSKPDQNASFIASKKNTPKQNVTFNVFKTNSTNVDTAYNDVKNLLSSEKPIQDGQFTIYSVQSAVDQINKQFGELTRDFIITVLLVFLVIFIFLGLRQAIIASLAIPLTFFISFTIMYITGIALSFIALFSLLLALGLLVDDTIVVVSAITAYYRSGKFTPVETGLLVWRDFVVAIFTTTITTVWAFLPLLLSTGIIGSFIKPIPIVVSSTLLASFFVAMLITLPFVIFFLKPTFPRRIRIFGQALLIIAIITIGATILPKGKLYPIVLLVFLLLLFIVYLTRDKLITSLRVAAFKRRSNPAQNSKRPESLSPLDPLSRLAHLAPQYKSSFANGIIHFTTISNRYHRAIESILFSGPKRRIALTIAIAFSLFAYLLVPLGLVHNEFFPKSNQDYVFMTVELPAGTNAQTSTVFAKRILTGIRKVPNVTFATADVGQSFNSNGEPSSATSNLVLFTLILPSKEQRSLTSGDIADQLRAKYGTIPDGKVSVVEVSGGPPAGSDVQIKLLGDDLTVLNQYADKVQSYLAKTPGVVNVDKTIKPGTSKLVFVPDPAKVADAGLTMDQLGFWLRLFASGFSANSVKFENQMADKEDLTIRLKDIAQHPEEFQSVIIPVQKNNIQLSSLGNLTMQNNPTTITREGGQRTISITASVTKGYSVSKINSDLEKYADDGLSLPSGYTWKTGGVNEENQNSVNSILAAMILSFVLIMITMVLQFGSFRRALIVMLVIPLSISGVFIIFALTNTPLSFPALIGILALFGIVVKNSILIVDKIMANEKAGLEFVVAIADASSSRLEAIALTSVATICGLIPITLSDPLWRGLGGAIVAGLLFSGTIMLFFIPVVYYYWFRDSVKR